MPLVGDVFDIAHRANTKNVALLETRAGEGGRARPRDWLRVALLVFVAALVGAVYVGYRVVSAAANAC